MNEVTDIRDAVFMTVFEAAKKDPNLIFITSDMGAWALSEFRRELPDQFINIGICEQTMVGVAAGLALSGKRVVIYAIIPFLALRAVEQIKVNLCSMALPVMIIGGGPGLAYASDGFTHHGLDDVAIMNTMPNLDIFNPGDPYTARRETEEALSFQNTSYLRLDKGAYPGLESLDSDPNISVLNKGQRLAVLVTGALVHEARDAVDELRHRGMQVGLVYVSRLKPLNNEKLLKALSDYEYLVVVDESPRESGLHCVSHEVINHWAPDKVQRLAMPSTVNYEYGSRDWLRQRFGLDKAAMITACLSVQAVEVDFPKSVSVDVFANIVGCPVSDLPERCSAFLQSADLAYRALSDDEHNAEVTRALTELTRPLKVSGPHREVDWQAGWSENYQELKSTGDLNTLVPKFVKVGAPVRFRGEYIYTRSHNFESIFVEALRLYLFDRYLGGYDSIHEFGCGSGHNLVSLAKRFPGKNLKGYDWAESSGDIVQLLREEFELDIEFERFDLYSDTFAFELSDKDACFSIGTLEQVGDKFRPFVDHLISCRVGVVVHVETLKELYDESTPFDYVASQYLKKRNYLNGLLDYLRMLESSGKVEILDVRKTIGSQFHDGYSYVVWRPIA